MDVIVGGNLGAYMVFTNCGPVIGASKVTNEMYYTVHSFDVSSQVG